MEINDMCQEKKREREGELKWLTVRKKNTARDYLETGDQSPASKEKTSNNVL